MYQFIGMINNVGMGDQQIWCRSGRLAAAPAAAPAAPVVPLPICAKMGRWPMAMRDERSAARASPPLSRRYHILLNK